MSFSCGLADRGLCDELITRAQESYRVGPGSKGLLRHGKIMRIGGMILTRENRNIWRKLCPSATCHMEWPGIEERSPRSSAGDRPSEPRNCPLNTEININYIYSVRTAQ